MTGGKRRWVEVDLAASGAKWRRRQSKRRVDREGGKNHGQVRQVRET